MARDPDAGEQFPSMSQGPVFQNQRNPIPYACPLNPESKKPFTVGTACPAPIHLPDGDVTTRRDYQEDKPPGSRRTSGEWVLTGGCGPLHAVTDRVPALTDHHADPSCRPAAVCCSPLPYSRGKGPAVPAAVLGGGEPSLGPAPIHPVLCHTPACAPARFGRASGHLGIPHSLWLSPFLSPEGLFAQLLFIVLYAHPPQLLALPSLPPTSERPSRHPDSAELLRDQPAPADCHVRLPRAAQGTR